MKEKLKPLMSHNSDEWETPKELFDKLDKEFNFNVDAAATDENALCRRYFDKEYNNALDARPWDVYNGDTKVWCNPPYSLCKEFVKKACEEWKRGCKIVMLLPARTDTRWFHEYIYQKNGVKVEFIKGRLKFSQSKNSAPFPSMLVYFL